MIEWVIKYYLSQASIEILYWSDIQIFYDDVFDVYLQKIKF